MTCTEGTSSAGDPAVRGETQCRIRVGWVGDRSNPAFRLINDEGEIQHVLLPFSHQLGFYSDYLTGKERELKLGGKEKAELLEKKRAQKLDIIFAEYASVEDCLSECLEAAPLPFFDQEQVLQDIRKEDGYLTAAHYFKWGGRVFAFSLPCSLVASIAALVTLLVTQHPSLGVVLGSTLGVASLIGLNFLLIGICWLIELRLESGFLSSHSETRKELVREQIRERGNACYNTLNEFFESGAEKLEEMHCLEEDLKKYVINLKGEKEEAEPDKIDEDAPLYPEQICAQYKLLSEAPSDLAEFLRKPNPESKDND
jgi:hypothetical protein